MSLNCRIFGKIIWDKGFILSRYRGKFNKLHMQSLCFSRFSSFISNIKLIIGKNSLLNFNKIFSSKSIYKYSFNVSSIIFDMNCLKLLSFKVFNLFIIKIIY